MVVDFGDLITKIYQSQESYYNDDAIVVTGNVTDLFPTQLSLWINAPNTGKIVYVDQISVASDKTFGTTVGAGGPLWREGGTYTLTVQYGHDAHRASTTFEYGRYSTVPPAEPPWYDGIISFEITGADVHSIVPVVEADSLLVNLIAYDESFLQQEQESCNSGDARPKIPTETDDGSLTIDIPRSIADATLDDGSDDQYFVLVDGEEREFQEVITDDSRTLTIEFEAGTEQIEIIGTWVMALFIFGDLACMGALVNFGDLRRSLFKSVFLDLPQIRSRRISSRCCKVWCLPQGCCKVWCLPQGCCKVCWAALAPWW